MNWGVFYSVLLIFLLTLAFILHRKIIKLDKKLNKIMNEVKNEYD